MSTKYPLEFRKELFATRHEFKPYPVHCYELSAIERRNTRAFSLTHGTDAAILNHAQFAAFMDAYADELIDDQGTISSFPMPLMSNDEAALHDALQDSLWKDWVSDEFYEMLNEDISGTKPHITLSYMAINRLEDRIGSVFTYEDMACLLSDTAIPRGLNLANALRAMDAGGHQDWDKLLEPLLSIEEIRQRHEN